MSADYSFYALLCGFMPRPEGVQKRETKVSRFFVCIQQVNNPRQTRFWDQGSVVKSGGERKKSCKNSS